MASGIIIIIIKSFAVGALSVSGSNSDGKRDSRLIGAYASAGVKEPLSDIPRQTDEPCIFKSRAWL